MCAIIKRRKTNKHEEEKWKMKWTSKQVEEMIAIKNIESWSISDCNGVLMKGFSAAKLVNALIVWLSHGYHIEGYTRMFTDGTLRVFIGE